MACRCGPRKGRKDRKTRETITGLTSAKVTAWGPVRKKKVW